MYARSSQRQLKSLPHPVPAGTVVNTLGGKDKDVLDFGDMLLMIHRDSLSGLGGTLPIEIAGKGRIVNKLSAFWFKKLRAICPNHLITVAPSGFPARIKEVVGDCGGRAMLVWKAMPLPIRCVVRGYLAGAGWREYRETGAICGNRLPPGLAESQRLPAPIFTPTTKGGAQGKNENISFSTLQASLGNTLADQLREASLRLYFSAWAQAQECGVIIAETKFEFGLHEGKLVLIDECLTPDTTRFWRTYKYRCGSAMASMDKQMFADYLETFNRWEEVPPFPESVLARLRENYHETYRMIVGKRIS